ncbi:MAG TPA: response regulator [Stellaceae bacterium]|nr:response regulator [Stellaceae bacterium]
MSEAKVNILLVDDQPAKLLTYETILAPLGENLIKAGSANEALEHLLKRDVAMILIDVCMPDLDGFQLAAMIREHPRFRSTAIIFVSAIQVTDLDLLRGYELGAVDYVSVPVVPELLRAKVKVFAELFRKTRQLERLNAELESRVAERTAELARANAELERRVEERTREREAALAQVHEMQKLESLGQLTGGVAHDFNNLLMAVLGNLELIRKYVPSDPRILRLVDGATQGAERGAALTKRLLAFARRQELRPEAVDVAKLVDSMIEMLSRSLGPMIRITTAFDPDLAPARVDPNQLELAILNLAVNARDAMPFGGDLAITAQRKKIGAAEVSGPGAGDYVSIAVRDSGCGMDEATVKRATEPFFTTKGRGRGTGLGLSMVHGLVAQSGGGMRIESRPNRGATIELWLPAAEQAEPERPQPMEPAGAGKIRACRVLVVDDDPIVAAGTAALLEDLGHATIEAGSGAGALDVLRSEGDIDIVITDYAMPGMTGAELAARIAGMRPGLPVIIASGYAELLEEEVTWPRLAKPYRQHDLAAMIQDLVGRRPAAAPRRAARAATR